MKAKVYLISYFNSIIEVEFSEREIFLKE